VDRREQLLAAYDDQIKGNDAGDPPGVPITVDGPVRYLDFEHQGFVDAGDLSALDGTQLDALIARAREHFTRLGRPVEWKTHGHDSPADLTDRLRTAGFEPEDEETIVIAETASIATRTTIPDGVAIRQTTNSDDMDRIAAMQAMVWEEPRDWLADVLRRELADQPDLIDIYVAEASGGIVSAGWVRYKEGTDFAGLWGGSTLRAWRGKGIYRALVAVRAQRARERGFRYLQVDASNESRPILERLGFVAVTTTTPYIFTHVDRQPAAVKRQ
jgi:GNAT superfamily N-acetyltransferase